MRGSITGIVSFSSPSLPFFLLPPSPPPSLLPAPPQGSQPSIRMPAGGRESARPRAIVQVEREGGREGGGEGRQEGGWMRTHNRFDDVPNYYRSKGRGDSPSRIPDRRQQLQLQMKEEGRKGMVALSGEGEWCLSTSTLPLSP